MLVGSHSEVSQYSAYNTTTNDTPVSLVVQDVLPYDLKHYDVDVYAVNTSTSQINVYNFKYTCKRLNGNVSIVPDSTSVAVIEEQDTGIGGVSADVQNDDPVYRVQLNVVGRTAQTIQWVAYVREFIYNTA
jgi:hypothetical protein